MSKSAVAKQEQTEIALAIPLEDLQKDAGAGSEEMRAADIQIPTLVVVQKMSPQVDSADAAYLAEAKPGMILDTLTDRLWDGSEGVPVVPVYFRPVVNHMKIVGEQGEFIATYPVTDPFVAQPTERDSKNRDVLKSDPQTYLQQVAQHFVILGESREPFVIRMKRTALRPSKRWNSLLEHYSPLEVDGRKIARPRFSIRCLLKTVREEKDGNSWFNWAPEISGDVTDRDLYEAGRTLHAMLRSGRADAAPEAELAEAGRSGDDIPF
ncbi:MAG: hypothetical protein ACYTBJ_20760 [Planctomycetota bacterium]|jgi:hypothetical protein